MRWISDPVTGLWQVARRVEIARSIRAGMPENASIDLDGFRWRDDDGDESSSGATFLELEDVNHTLAGAADSDTIIRLRILLEQDNILHDQGDSTTPRLEAKLNIGGTWAAVPAPTAGTYIEISASLLNDNNDTTDHGLTKSDPGTPYTHNTDPGAQEESTSVAGVVNWDGTDQTSAFYEWAVHTVALGLGNGDVIYFRVTDNGTLLDTYTFGDASDTNPITITVTGAAPAVVYPPWPRRLPTQVRM